MQACYKLKFDLILEMEQEGKKAALSWGQLGGEEALAAIAGGNCSYQRLHGIGFLPNAVGHGHIKSWKFPGADPGLAWAWSWPSQASFKRFCEIPEARNRKGT